MRERGALAARLLGTAMETPDDLRCPHIWLPMGELAAERLAARLLRAGIEVTPPTAPVVDPAAESGVRICIGAVAERGRLESALTTIAASLTHETSDRVAAVI